MFASGPRLRTGSGLLRTVAVGLCTALFAAPGAATVAALDLPARGAIVTAGAGPSARVAAFDRLDRIRDLVSTGRLVDALRAATGVTPEAGSVRPARARISPAGVPARVASAIGELDAAVREATLAVRRATKGSPQAIARLARRIDAVALSEASDTGELSSLRARVSGLVDQRAVDRAALDLAAALDRALPVLRAYAETRRSSSAQVAGCDVVDQPALCVGGEQSNVYDRDYPLVVDLGGDDVYRNSAGAAAPTTNGLPVSLNVDTGGNDVYDSTTVTSAHSVLGQGVGMSGGIGILVDLSGDDSYAVTSSRMGVEPWGQGISSIGVGVLDDLGGNDTYRASFVGPPSGSLQYVRAQGFGGIGGSGLLLDGGGNDSYAIESRSPIGGGAPEVLGIGQGLVGGTGLVSDGGGTDSFSLLAEAVSSPGDASPAQASAVAEGMGYGSVGGSGIVLTGMGPTTWTATARAVSNVMTGTATTQALGASLLGGFGAVSDGGGDDTYRVEAVNHVDQRISVADGCTCWGADADAETAERAAITEGLGFSENGSVSVLRDVAGNDHYSASSTATASASAKDARTNATTASPHATANAIVGTAETAALGAAFAQDGTDLAGGAAFVQDDAGDDVYETSSSNGASAQAAATLAGGTVKATALAAAVNARSEAVGMSGGYGELRDLGGVDSYRTTATSTAAADPAAEAVPGAATSSTQASAENQGSALLVDRDGGAADSFAATPPDPVCMGQRGGDSWQDCGGAAFGTNS